jgi:16S rRNA processing protein RimM
MHPSLEAAVLPADAIEVGRIADAWGIKGWFKVLPHSASPEALFSSKRWYLLAPDRPVKGVVPWDGALLLKIKEAKDHSDTVVASSESVPDRTAAEALRGARVMVARSSFPTAGENEYYWVDLIGLDVFNRQGEAMGQVKDLLSTGPQTVLVLAYLDAEAKEAERMIPFVAAFVDAVDVPGRRITVDWQADY